MNKERQKFWNKLYQISKEVSTWPQWKRVEGKQLYRTKSEEYNIGNI